MAVTPAESPIVERIRSLVAPIVADLGLDLYDLEQRGGTLRVTLDTPAGSPDGVDLDQLALATRLISRELDHDDPVPGRYTLEVTSPGVERTLRLPAHYRREIGKTVNVRLVDAAGERRRIEGVLVAADDTTATVRVDDPDTGDSDERQLAYAEIDRARTVFVWGPTPKPGGPSTRGRRGGSSAASSSSKGTTKGSQGATKHRGAARRATKENHPS